MNGTVDQRFVGGVLLLGGVLAMVGNALHPFLDPHGGGAELVARAGETSYWTALHLVVVVAVVLLTAGTVMLMRGFAGTAGEATGRLAAALAVVGGTIFAIQIGGLDGAVFPALADQLAGGADEASVLAVADAMQALDVALLAIVTTVYLGGVFVAAGLSFHRVDAFAPWMRWTAMVAGGAGVVIGVMMFLGVADVVAFYGFRAVALAVTVVTLGLGFELRRSTVHAVSSPGAPAAA